MKKNPLLYIHTVAKYLSPYLPLGDGIDFGEHSVTRHKKRQGEGYAIVGRTGTGKTYFIKSFIHHKIRLYPELNTYIIDSKKQGDFSRSDGIIVRSYLPPPLLTGSGQVQIWQPMEDNIEYYDEYFKKILHAGKPANVVVDEAKNIVFGDKIPRNYTLLASQGRLPGIDLYTGTQEVAQAPRQMFSQSKHIICFRLFNQYDAGVMRKYLRIHEKELPLKGIHSCLYMNTDTMGEPKLYENSMKLIQDLLMVR